MGFLKWIDYMFERIDDKSLSLQAADAWRLTRYSASNVDEVVRKTIRDINDFIKYKARMNGQTKVVYMFKQGYDEVAERVKAHFEGMGYRTRLKPLDPEDGEGMELSVSWYRKWDSDGEG